MSIIVFAPPPEFDFDPDIQADAISIPSTPGATGTGTLITYVVPVAQTLWLKKVQGSCNTGGKFTILEDTTIIGTGRVGSGDKNWIFDFKPAFAIGAGGTLTVEFLKFSGGSDSDVEAFASGRLI